MRLSELLGDVAITERLAAAGGPTPDPHVADIRHDSRQVGPGDLFVAIEGTAYDGHDFLADVAHRGANVVVGTDASALQRLASDGGKKPSPALLLVDDARDALWRLCRSRYLDAIRGLALLGVTGTNGKTTVAHLLEAVLKAADLEPGVLGTVGHRFRGQTETAQHTTPEAPVLWQLLAAMRREGAAVAVMEVSSHALEQRRADGLPFTACAFTNLTQDHLDFHGTFEAYWRAKRRLFVEIAPHAPVVIDLDDPTGAGLAAELGSRAIGTSAQGTTAAVVRPEGAVAMDLGGIRCVLQSPVGPIQMHSALLGRHNLANICTAVGLACQLELDATAIATGLAALRRVPGRLENVVPSEPIPFQVFIDYAHTPDALGRVLAAMRPLTTGRLIVLFGCGGDRDIDKRLIMGATAARNADLVIVTSDNPRSEDPDRIIDDIRVGLTAGDAAIEVEPDRRRAIALALELATDGDVVLIAGKGHEAWQTVGDQRRPFDDRKVALELMS